MVRMGVLKGRARHWRIPALAHRGGSHLCRRHLTEGRRSFRRHAKSRGQAPESGQVYGCFGFLRGGDRSYTMRVQGLEGVARTVMKMLLKTLQEPRSLG